jgi:hypothetical protein
VGLWKRVKSYVRDALTPEADPVSLAVPTDREWIAANRIDGHRLGCNCDECQRMARSMAFARGTRERVDRVGH